MLPVSLCQTNPVSPDQATINCKKGHPAWVTLLWYLPSPFQSYKAMVCSVELSNFEANIERKREKDIGQSLSTSVIQLTLACSRLSDSGEDAKEKGTLEKLAGREKGKRLWVMGSCWRVFVLLTKLLQQSSRPDSKQALSASKQHLQHIAQRGSSHPLYINPPPPPLGKKFISSHSLLSPLPSPLLFFADK